MMKSGLGLFILSLVFVSTGGGADFPRSPDGQMTPGTLCTRPTSKRYAEQIPYCSRSVDGSVKQEVMRQYDRQLGFKTTQLPRAQFKIDHLIPLCMGGSNDAPNLWPQHQTIFLLTDRAEQLLCEKMAAGRIEQAEAVHLILDMKQRPETGPELVSRLEKN